MEALHLCLRGRRPDPATRSPVESPSYYGLLQLIERPGDEGVRDPANARGTGLDLELLEDYAWSGSESGLAWQVTNFSNPIGSRMPDASKQALLSRSPGAPREVPLIEDDISTAISASAKRARAPPRPSTGRAW